MLSIEISNNQKALKPDAARLERAVDAILRDAGIGDGELSIALVDDPTIHHLNRHYLDHDYPTDVLSFVLESEGPHLDGEVIVSADTAIRSAAKYGWTAEDELLLYLIHGTLHLVGYDDRTPEDHAKMRDQERRYLALFGLQWREEPVDKSSAT